MSRGYLTGLALLTALWGASYMFIKVAVEEIPPAAMIELRLLLATAALGGVLLARVGWSRLVEELRAAGRGALVLGILNMALPFTLIAWGEIHIDSGVAAIANASVPIFVALLALRLLPSERVTGLRLAGVVLGLVGVGVLTGFRPEGGWLAVAGTLAVVVASVSYAAASLYAQRRFPATSPLVIATASAVAGSIVLLPFALVRLPDRVPSWEALGSVAALGLLGTAVASLVLFRMLLSYGSSRTTLVTYLLPPMALVYGVVLLGESVTAGALLGLALILGGVAVASGAVRAPRRGEPLPATPRP